MSAYRWSLPLASRGVTDGRARVVKSGNGRQPRKDDRLTPARCTTYHWRGKEYYGLSDLAEESGFHARTILKHMAKYKNLDRLGTPRSRNVKMDVEGHRWSCMAYLSQDVGIPWQTVQRAVNEGGSTQARLRREVLRWAKKNDKQPGFHR